MLVEDHDGLLLLRPPTDDTLRPADVADLARALRAENGDPITIVAAADGGAETTALWPRLSETFCETTPAGVGRAHARREQTDRLLAELNTPPGRYVKKSGLCTIDRTPLHPQYRGRR